jgi:hypothetical protein
MGLDIHVGKTMPFLPPMTGNGKFIPPKHGDFPGLFYPGKITIFHGYIHYFYGHCQ